MLRILKMLERAIIPSKDWPGDFNKILRSGEMAIFSRISLKSQWLMSAMMRRSFPSGISVSTSSYKSSKKEETVSVN